MSVEVGPLEKGQETAWDQFVLEHPQGSPFHQVAWKRAIEEVYGWQPYYLAAWRGGELAGVLPLFLITNPLAGRILLSTPFAVYGGALADGDDARTALAEEVRRCAATLKVQYVELRNAWPEQQLGFTPVVRYVTFTQEIGPDEEAILASIPRKTRYMVRKALKPDYTTRVTRDRTRFEALYLANLKKLGTPAFSRRHFAALDKHFGAQMDIRETVLGGKVAAAVLTFYFRDQVLPYYGASDPAFNEFAPNNYMYFDLMRWGGQNGYRLYDFGRSKTMESGSYDFKAHWGMAMRELPYEMLLVRRKELPNFSPNNPKFRAAIEFWQKLPLGLANWLGPWLIRLFP